MRKWENFTADRVANFKCKEGKTQTIYWDGKMPGLGVRVTSAGAKSYIFEATLHGKTLRTTIGDIRNWPIGKAQAEAARLKSLTDSGSDPRQLDRQKREKADHDYAMVQAQKLLVKDAWDSYINYQKDKMLRPHIERGKKWGERHLADHEYLVQKGGEEKKRGGGKTKQGALYPLMQMRMTDINSEALKSWQKAEAVDRPNSARQGFEMFRAFWRWCNARDEYQKIIDPRAVEDKELRDEVPSRKTKKFDVLEKGQLAAWFGAVSGLSNQIIRTYLQALILTGARREEMAGLRWTDVDFQWNSIWVKDKVQEEGRKIPLTPYLRYLIDQLPRNNQWVFSSEGAKDGRMMEPRIGHNKALSVAGLPQVTLHGLRRTFASLAEWVEMPRGIVAQIMGHAPSATAERHYINRPLDLLAVWHSKYEKWILSEAQVQLPDQVNKLYLEINKGNANA